MHASEKGCPEVVMLLLAQPDVDVNVLDKV